MLRKNCLAAGGLLATLAGCAAGESPEATEATAADLTVGQALNTLVSFNVTTPGYTDRYLRHQAGLGVTSPLGPASDEASRRDASFFVRPGLANASCYSFESQSFPGHFLRHSNYRLRKDPNDGSALFKADATFCARTGLTGAETSLESYNLTGRYLRHKNAEVWVGNANGTGPGDGGGAVFAADATWRLTPGLATAAPSGAWPSIPPRADGKWVRVKNGCSFPIWVHAASAPDQGNVVLGPDDAQLSPGAFRDYLAPNTWPSARVTAYGDGPRAGELEKAEMTFGGGVLNYNITYVDWVGLPLEVTAAGGNCSAAAHTTGCYAKQDSLTSTCPEGFLREGKKCLSARTYCANPVNQSNPYCHLLDGAIANCPSCPKDSTTNVYMCAGLYANEPRWCAALNRGMVSAPEDPNPAHYYVNPPFNTYSKWVHQVCPDIYAFPYDDWLSHGGFRSCSGDEVRVTFCPAG